MLPFVCGHVLNPPDPSGQLTALSIRTLFSMTNPLHCSTFFVVEEPASCDAGFVPLLPRWTVQVAVPCPPVTVICSLSIWMVNEPLAGNPVAVPTDSVVSPGPTAAVSHDAAKPLTLMPADTLSYTLLETIRLPRTPRSSMPWSPITPSVDDHPLLW